MCQTCQRGYYDINQDKSERSVGDGRKEDITYNPHIVNKIRIQCAECDCSREGSLYSTCNQVPEVSFVGGNLGACTCKDGYKGRRCTECTSQHMVRALNYTPPESGS